MRMRILSLLLLVVLSSAGVGCTAQAPEVTATVIVPRVTEQSEATARSVLTKAGLKVGVVTKTPYPAGSPAVVITQYPAAQSPAAPGTAVDLTVAEPATK
jgi:beta-lactam-binding protein with PASTA domain